MTVYLDDPDFTLHVGDALTVLRELPDETVDCVITSPPYWGLRDYGTGEWEGGNAECDHKQGRDGAGRADGVVDDRAQRNRDGAEALTRQICKCGARRVDQQLGLEPTPDEYVTRMVQVFREVRRVLAPHGTCWVNLGSSYASGEVRRDARQRDTACTEPPGSPDPGSACRDLCDGCATALSNRTAGSSQLHAGSEPHAALTGRDRSRPGSASASRAASLPDAQESTTQRSAGPLRAACSHCSNCGACLDVLRSSSRDAQACARREAYRNGNGRNGWESHIPGTGAWGTAWLNYKPKDMVPTPWLVAMALQADGWYLRADIVWSKPNPMPESVTDRPTKAHEYVFLLTKQPRYWFDQEAVREPAEWQRWGAQTTPKHNGTDTAAGWIKPKGKQELLGEQQAKLRGGDTKSGFNERWFNGEEKGLGRNSRSVWEIATQPYPEAHFATYPEELVRRCLLAGCPEWVCRTCGKPSERIVDSSYDAQGRTTNGPRSLEQRHETAGFGQRLVKSTETLGWSDCGHNDWRAGVVLDPFLGSGTTALVARKHGRHTIGIELSADYCDLIATRLQQLSLLA